MPNPTANSYAGVTILNSMDKVNLNRDPLSAKT